MKYIEQTPDAYVLALFLGEDVRSFDPTVIKIVRKISIVHGDYEIVVAIIGASHYVQILRHGTVILVDMLACAEPNRFGFQPTITAPLEKRNSIRNVDTWLETTRGEVWSYNHRLWRAANPRSCRLIQQSPLHTTISYAFPGPRKPKTIVSVGVQSHDTVVIHTQHEFALHGRLLSLVSCAKYKKGRNVRPRYRS